ncbi:MAG: preprotein translocase subunit SecE [Chloroflexi bacterium]|nr:preprotein translocase subunit SecE [Chloroflexota bacterium]
MATRPTVGAVEFAREAIRELRLVTWPTREMVVRLTLIVLVISALMGVYIFLADNVFTMTITNGLLGAPATPAPAP